MSRKSQVKEIIDAYIHRNGNQEITGNILNSVLVSMLNAPVIDIIQDGHPLPKDEDGNVIVPMFTLDGAVRYDIEQILTEVEKEIARRNIGAVSTAEMASAIGGVRNDLTAEVQRATTEELRIAGLIGAMYTNAQIDAFLAPKMERVELAMIASQTPLKITYKGQTTALTFEEIKALVQNTAKFVTLLVDDAYLLIPSLDYYDDAVQFVGTNILTGQAEAVRVMINSSNIVSCYAIELETIGHKISSMEGVIPADQYIKYPNVKAVIDYVAAHSGGLTPEQEEKLDKAVTARDAEGQGVPALPFLTDAPKDGKQYTRKNGEWSESQGGESGKQGVLSQTVTYTKASDGGYDVTISDIVRGTIPQVAIDMASVVDIEAVFNESTGYFELGGVNDISYREMLDIIAGTERIGSTPSQYYFAASKVRVAVLSVRTPAITNFTNACYGFSGQSIVIKSGYNVSNGTGAFARAWQTKTISPILPVSYMTAATNMFSQCYSLESVHLRSLKTNLSFSDSPRLESESIAYIINNVDSSAGNITITLHATAYARANADAGVQAALAAHTNVTLASA